MNKIKLFSLTIAIICCFTAFSQKKELTLDKAILGGRDLAPTSWSNVQWAPKNNILYYSKRGGNYIYSYNPSKNNTDSIDLVSTVNPVLKASGLDELKSVPFFTVSDLNVFEFTTGDQKVSFQTNSKQLTKVFTPAKDLNLLDVAPKGNSLAYVKDQALFVRLDGGSDIMVAQGNDSIVYGESVHRQEFGIDKGTFWSPTGEKLAFYRMDQSMVKKYPIPIWSVTPAKVNYIYYPMAGQKSHHVTLGIYDLASRKITYLDTGGDPEHYLTNICWSPDGNEVYIAEINRDQNHTTFNAYNPVRGNKIRTLYEEQSLQYTEPLVPYTFVPQQNSLLIAQSKRDGWNSLYLYTHEGELVRQLTRGIEVTDILGFDNKNKKVFFQGILPNSIDLQYFQSELSTGKVTQFSNIPGLHNAKISFDGKYAFESNSALNNNSTYICRNLSKNTGRTLLSIQDPIHDYNIGQTILDTLYADDGTRLFARTILPYNFDASKKYPVVIYVYGGPHAQMIRNGRLAQAPLWMYTMANEGFILFTVDNRGSSNRGIDFEKVTHRSLGSTEIDDQMVGYRYIQGKPFVDANKIGVHGWSFGGFMTISMMTRQPDKFYAAVAGGPVTDWNMYEIMYTERYMDTPEQNPDGYKTASTFSYIDQLHGPLLLIHGSEDDVVIWQQSINYIESCVKKGKQVNYFVYPGHKHNVLGKDRIHLIRKVIDYFKLHM